MGKVANFLLGILVGGAIGAGIGMLLAPTSGNELRQQIGDRASSFQTEIKNAAAVRRAELEQQLADLRLPRRPASS